MEALTNEEVMALIKRGIEFKNGAKAAYEDQHIISKPRFFFERFNSYPERVAGRNWDLDLT